MALVVYHSSCVTAYAQKLKINSVHSVGVKCSLHLLLLKVLGYMPCKFGSFDIWLHV